MSVGVTYSRLDFSSKRPVPIENLEAKPKTLQGKDPVINLQLQADRRTAGFESVAKAMACALRSGMGKLSFVTVQE
jgi:biopolymer transport protein ExbD